MNIPSILDAIAWCSALDSGSEVQAIDIEPGLYKNMASSSAFMLYYKY